MNRIIVSATKDDKKQILELYHKQIGRRFCPWNESYPGEAEIDFDLSTDSIFVMKEDGRIIGSISIDYDEMVAKLPVWTLDLQPGGEIARVAVEPDCQGQGIAGLLVEHSMEVMKQRGMKSIHLLVNKHNIPALKCYDKFGFTNLGDTFMYEQPFWCYEKKL